MVYRHRRTDKHFTSHLQGKVNVKRGVPISREVIAEIRRLYNEGALYKQIMHLLGVSEHVISKYRTPEARKHRQEVDRKRWIHRKATTDVLEKHRQYQRRYREERKAHEKE